MATRSSRGTPIKRDYSGEEWREPGEGYDGPVPRKGMYPYEFVSVVTHISKDDNEGLKWTFRMTDEAQSKDGSEQYEGFTGYIYTNEDSTLWKEQQCMVAIGAIKPNGSYNGTLEALTKKYGGTVVMGRTVRERYFPEDGDGEGEWTAKLQTVIKRRDTGDDRPARSRRDDDSDVDEDEEERPARSAKSTGRRSKPAPEPEPEPDEDEDDEGYDLNELGDELEKLTLVALKKRAKEEWDFTTSELRGVTAEDLIEQILDKVEQEQGGPDEEDEEDEEPEPEPEPEPEKPARRTRGSSKPAARRRGRSEDTDDDPPF